MPGMGPVPKPDHQRIRSPKPLHGQPKLLLPAEGRKGDPPDWPIPNPTRRELDLWRDQWAKPQAIMWERARCFEDVAMMCRLQAEAERHDAPIKSLVECRQLRDRLGLTPMALLRLGWAVAADELEPARQQKTDTRERLRAIDPNAVARPE